MRVILGTIEMPRCEGRLIPVKLFDDIDRLESMVLHGQPSPTRLAEWEAVIREFGAYYHLDGSEPIVVDPVIHREAAARYSGAPHSGTWLSLPCGRRLVR